MTEERKYVLRSKAGLQRLNNCMVYYTGGEPTAKIREAKFFSLEAARGAKQFATTGTYYEIKRVTDKEIFEKTLKGL